ncbi:AbrB/MazE/SpoVT family DNA-binding domain-containing protein [Sphingomonas sp. H39-1-10]|nr:AbrB/MazE/SpoVT family DNA-binding domain-containing protein [Sphingomonas pollutisoli]
MSVEITISSKGQVVIPKDVRDALGLRAGEKLRLSHRGRRITMEPVGEPVRERISYEEFRRRIPAYEGPPVAVEEMSARIGELFEDWPSRP